MSPAHLLIKPVLILICLTLHNGCNEKAAMKGNSIALTSHATGPTNHQPALRDIAIGDSIEIFVKEDPSFNEIYQVRESGHIIIPKVGRIKVSGLSIFEAESKIKATLEPDQLQTATVIVDRLQSKTHSPAGQASIIIYLTGKVKAPGQHTIPMGEGRSVGLYEALLIGGGTTKFADIQKIHALRNGKSGLKSKIAMNVKNINQGKTADIAARSGDIIVVPERVFGF
jgi:protein involved in polysaccharide export with SLBB domain